MNDFIISAKNITKRFGDFEAVKDISIDVRRGEIFGFLGPNGAGKTTTIRMLTMLSPPTSGIIEVCGREVRGMADPVIGRIGIIQQHISLDKDVTVRDNIMYHAILHRIPRKEAERRMGELASFMGLDPYLDKLVINLSGGWKRRTAIICAMMHKPEILFLDEPTSGLDTQSRHMLWDLIRMLNANGTTVFITTHYMDEAEELCDRVAVIDHGTVVATGSPEDLCKSVGLWTVEYRDGNGSKIYRYFSDWNDAGAFQKSLSLDSKAVSRATNLEDVFLELTGRTTSVTEEVAFRV